MSQKKELRELVLEYLLLFGLPAVLFVAFIYLFIWTGNNALAPLINALTAYLDKFGRATAEGFTLITLVGFGLKFYDETTTGMSKDFLEYIKKLDLEICSLRISVNCRDQDILKLKTEIGELQTKLDEGNSKIKRLREENLSHQTEIERLKDPEGMARKEQAAVQKHNDQNLKSIAESIRWGRS